MKKDLHYNFPETDFNYVFQDFLIPINSVNAEIEKLIALHESDSRSVPFFLKADADQVSSNLPDGWAIEINQNQTVQPESIRIVIYNAYWHAERNLNEPHKSVMLNAQPLGGDFIIIDKIEVDGSDDYTDLLSLDGAFGNSPIMILITPGSAFKAHAAEFKLDELDQAVEFIETLQLN